jgi:anti-sigma regulatory factor (Ser/Thr protein kinase)
LGDVDTRVRADVGFVHQALLHDGPADLVHGVVPFIEEGLDAGDAVMVAVLEPLIEPIRAELDPGSDEVHFLDMAEVGRNPARIIPLWQEFLDAHATSGQRVRGVGQPVWAGRSPAELAECHIHEALLNTAFDHGTAWSLLCPYDVSTLSADDVAQAHCTHPHLTEASGVHPSTGYAGAVDVFAPELPPPPPDAIRLEFTAAQLRDLRAVVATEAAAARIERGQTDDLLLAVSELATNSILHGGGAGVLRIWCETGALVCEVSDTGNGAGHAPFDPLVGRIKPKPGQLGGMGLWIANQVCDLVQVRTGPSGTTVRTHLRSF